MKKTYLLMSGLFIGAQFVTGCDNEDVEHVAAGPDISVRAAHRSLSVSGCDEEVPGVSCGDYRYPARRDPEISPDLDTELYARVYAPSPMEDGKRYPLLVFQHGIHGACGDTSTSPRIDTGDNYLFTGQCLGDHVFVKNHEGYGYIANALAARGYIVVSVNASRGIQTGTGYEGKARGRLLLKHLEKLARWDQGIEPTPSELGFELRGHVDLSQVGLMGHTQGSKSVRWAYKLAQDDEEIDWETRLGTSLGIRGIFEIAPIDTLGTTTVATDPVNVPLAVLLPLCDGSGTQSGVNVFDRSMTIEDDIHGIFRATVAVEGANRNYFNTEWEHSDASSRDDSTACVGQEPLFTAETRRQAGWYTEGITGSEQQREVGRQLVTRFFLGTVGADKNPAKAAVFDPRNGVPPEISSVAKIDRGFSASTHPDDVLVLEDFRNGTGYGMSGVPAGIQGATLQHMRLSGHDNSYNGALVVWERKGDDHFYEVRFAREGSGVDLEGFDTIDFRIDPTNDPEINKPFNMNFTVQLVHSNGELSNARAVSSYVTLSDRDRLHSVLQTARISLSDFGEDFPLDSIHGIRFVFNKSTRGGIVLGSIRAVKGGIKDDITVTPCEESVQGVSCLDYKYPPKFDVEMEWEYKTRLEARLYTPALLEEGKRYPVLVFQHGRHGFCGDSSYEPRADFVHDYLWTGECPEGEEFVKNYAGYGYIANEMAAHGYIVVSVDASVGIIGNSMNESKARGRLLLKHLEKLAQWDQGREATPEEFGFDLQGHVDFEQVGLMGHSRAGRSVRNAYRFVDKGDTIDWAKRLGTNLKFRGIFELASWEDKSSVDPVGVPMVNLLPLCDGQVNINGVQVFDRSMSLTSETPGVFRATVAVEGANHTFFNTEWRYSSVSSTGDTSCVAEKPLFQADKYRVISEDKWDGWYADGVTGSRIQREVGRQLMTRFFLGTVGANRDPAKAALFDPRNKMPAEISAITNVERGFSPSSNSNDIIVFEEFTEDFIYNPPEAPGFSVEYKSLIRHYKKYRGAHIMWESANENNVFESYLTEDADLQGYETLDFRVDPFSDEVLNVSDIDFSIQLVDGNGTPSEVVKVSDFVTLSDRKRIYSVLQTVRIPLGNFKGISLSDVSGVKFTFNDTSSGSIYLASIRATKGGLPVSGPIRVEQDSYGELATYRVSGRGDMFASYFTPASWAYGPHGQENFRILLARNENGYETDSSFKLNGTLPHAVGTGTTWFEFADQVDIVQSNTVSNPLQFDATSGENYVFIVDGLYNGAAVRIAGDVDGDGDFDVDDESLVEKEVAEGDILNRIQSAVADVNCDNRIDLSDIQLFAEGDMSGCR